MRRCTVNINLNCCPYLYRQRSRQALERGRDANDDHDSDAIKTSDSQPWPLRCEFHHGLIIIVRVVLRTHKKRQKHQRRKEGTLPWQKRERQTEQLSPDDTGCSWRCHCRDNEIRNEVCDRHLHVSIQVMLKTQRQWSHARHATLCTTSTPRLPTSSAAGPSLDTETAATPKRLISHENCFHKSTYFLISSCFWSNSFEKKNKSSVF